MPGNEKEFEVIIVGGSYAGLSAAMSLGRALRNTLIIDSNKPCNAQTPYSHNFITQDGETPRAISERAKRQVLVYPTVSFLDGLVVRVKKIDSVFLVHLETGETFRSKKVLFATGIKDNMPEISGYAECWGISILHCPYCHGYEVRNEKTGIFGNGDPGFELVKMISHWTKNLTLFTNGPSTLTEEQRIKIESYKVTIVETGIDSIEQNCGYVSNVHLKDRSSIPMKAIYAKPAFVQHCSIPVELGCELTGQNLLKVDAFQKTTVKGVYAAGDNSVFPRSVSPSVASGTLAGAFLNKELIEDSF